MSTAQARAAADAQAAEEAARSSLATLAATVDTPPPAPPAPTPPPAPPAPAPTATPVDLEAQLRRMQQQLDSAAGRLQQQDQELQRLRTAPPPAPPAPANPPPELITAKDREEYGDDLIGLVERVVKQITGTTLSDLQAKATMLEGQLGNVRTRVEATQQTAGQIAEERYLNALNALIPGWEDVNLDQGFIDWLGNVDKLSSKSYMELLQSAHKSADAQRVAHIFKLYKPDLGSAPPAATPPAATPQTPPAHIDPSSLAAPATMPSAPAPAAPPPGKIWTQAEVDKMFEDDAKGRITKPQFLALEADYMKALREGRVQAQ